MLTISKLDPENQHSKVEYGRLTNPEDTRVRLLLLSVLSRFQSRQALF